MSFKNYKCESTRAIAVVKRKVDVFESSIGAEASEDAVFGDGEVEVVDEELREAIHVLVTVGVGRLLFANVIAGVGQVERLFDNCNASKIL